ncbi:MAG: ATP-binding protein [Phyllobacterium sp.]
MNRFSAMMRTTAARLSALYLLLFTLCAVALVFYMTSLSVNFLIGQTQQAIDEEIGQLGTSYARGGIAQLVRTIDRRSRQPGASLYIVTDQAGRIIAGNVESLEAGVLDEDRWIGKPFQYQRIGENSASVAHMAVARVIALPNGMRILVGRDVGEPERFRLVVRNALILALAIMGIGAFLIWFFVGRHALKRIDQVSRASQRIMDGDLAGRLPVSGSGDEFDRLSENLNGMLTRIQELNEGVRQVSDNIAHDLKTPLTRLNNKAEMALADEQSPEAYRAALESVIDESAQIIRTFNAILMISRLEAGYSSENMETMSLSGIVADVYEMYEPVAEDAGVALSIGSLDETSIKANRELVAQTISNLVDNAIKYAVSDGETPQVALAVERIGNALHVSVNDNGAGIPADHRERATERFVRLEESRTQPGSGLGLSLAKAVMKLHGGSLRLEDNEPGLKAVLVFPVGEDKE